ncbi:hypothetical protein C922_00907 [Plasmodium inui San Antonio 1]|uniref:Uncharacterized protein n=1 Tax=Plasmodium inui San Antonio 1 TaxID=1237626 RepID=W7AST6_9APIC|nr:hypothetical protein C922_00907 [Plasmodium inui San Antonio 1]EUD68511.1 hypothetical protein C922_00907 [Plasmodium inui San Antonio 1]
MKRRAFLRAVHRMERRFFFNSVPKEKLNKIVSDYFYVEKKIHKVIDPRGGEAPGEANGKAAPLNSQENKPNEIEGLDYIKSRQTQAEQLTMPFSDDFFNYINSSKCFIHLCAFYIHNDEKKKFLQLIKKAIKYSFGYEDLFILFYLMCRVNYRDSYVLRKVLSVLEMYYFKIENDFSYDLSKVLFAPHTNLHSAINHLPLIYKVKLVNMDRGSPDGNLSMADNATGSDTTQQGDKEKKSSSVKEDPQGKQPMVQHINDAEAENVLENLQDVDMEQYEKEVSKDSVPFININVKREKRKIKVREGKHQGLKLKGTLLTQIKNEVGKMLGECVNVVEADEAIGTTEAIEETKSFVAKGTEDERNMFQMKEVLTIFIHDKELGRKNSYVQDLIGDVVKYFIAQERTPLLRRNMLTLLAFMDAQNYYTDKKLNRAVERALGGCIASMNEWSEQGIYDFINCVTKEEGPGRGLFHSGVHLPPHDALAFLYDQQYTYNFSLYEEDAPYRNKYHHATNKLLKNFFFLLSYMLRMPFLKFHILKSYLNSFNFFLDIFIKNENVCSSLDIAEISFLCESFLRRKIVDLSITHKILHLVRQAVGKCVKFDLARQNDAHMMEDAHVGGIATCPIYLNDILSILHFLHFYNLTTEQLHSQLLVICLGNFLYLNDTQKFILFNCVEALRRRVPNQIRTHVLNYFMYEKNLDIFLARNKNVQRESLGLLFVN